MKTLTIVMLITALTPLAAAECVGPACVTENSFADGACADGGTEGGTTRVDVEGAASASGSWYCSGSAHENTILVSAAGASVQWTEFGYSDPENGDFRGCFIGTPVSFSECPGGVAPPNPGWGNVLP